jgi:ABC-type ATPase with predicted acetyltransferase domain
MYCTIGATVDFKEFPDQSIRTFNELTEFEDGEYLAVRYKLKGKAKDFLGIDQEAIKRSYKKTKVFFDIELTEEELVFDDSLSIEDIAQEFIENKGLSDKELNLVNLFYRSLDMKIKRGKVTIIGIQVNQSHLQKKSLMN